MVAALTLLLALTRAEIVQRMRAPVVTQADGMVRVYADCPDDMRVEFQQPVASFAAETVNTLCRGLSVKPPRYASAPIVVHVGNGRTNDLTVVTRVRTNEAAIATHLYLKSPGYSDLARFRIEMIKAFVRAVKRIEIDDERAVLVYRRADPELRRADRRSDLEDWLRGASVPVPGAEAAERDEKMLRQMHTVLEPGKASRRDVLIFASRLFIYPEFYDERFPGGYDCLSLRDAIVFAPVCPQVRTLARRKADELPVLAGGRSAELREAAELYAAFLRALADGEEDRGELLDRLDAADAGLSTALESAGRSVRAD